MMLNVEVQKKLLFAEGEMMLDVVMQLAAGELVALTGPSGSGKTTLLHLLAGLMRPKEGMVKIANTDLSTLSSTKLDHFRGKHIGIVFQRSHFIRALSVEDNLLVAQHLAGIKPSKARAHELLKRLRIDYKAHSKTDSLSQGEQQRLAIARALINKPDIILADEPTGNLDSVMGNEVMEILLSLNTDEKTTIVMVTHDESMARKTHRLVRLFDGSQVS